MGQFENISYNSEFQAQKQSSGNKFNNFGLSYFSLYIYIYITLKRIHLVSRGITIVIPSPFSLI